MPGFNRELVKEKEQAVRTKRKLVLVASKGSLDMAYPPLILGNAARAAGMEVDIFFTFWGLDIITKKKNANLHVATVGNPNMHPMFHIPTMMGGLPGMSEMASTMMRKEIDALEVPPVPEFVDMLADAGVGIYACLMTVDMMKLCKEDLVDYAEIVDANQFIEMMEGAQVIFV